MKIAIYSRKSKFTGKGESIENQIQMCKEYAINNLGEDVSFSIYEDEGFSGGNLQRPKFQKLMEDIKKKNYDVLICYRLDRISRNVADFSSTLELLQDNNCSFISIREQFDTSSPMGRAMIYIASVFAQLERETIAERVKDNMMEMAKNGHWTGGRIPVGFNSEKIKITNENGSTKEISQLIINDNECKFVEFLYKKYLELGSLHKLECYIAENNIKSKNEILYEKSTLKIILQNPIYVKSNDNIIEYLKSNSWNVYGEADGIHSLLTYNKTEQSKKNGKFIKQNKPIEERFAAVSSIKGFIEPTLWLDVQRQFDANKDKFPRLGKTHNALLIGKLRCGKCKEYMLVQHGRVSKTTGEKIFYYVCSLKRKSHRKLCTNHNAKAFDIEKLVLMSLKKLSANKKDFITSIENLNKKNLKSNEIEVEKLSLIKSLDSKKAQIENLVTKLSVASDIADILISKIRDLKEECSKIENQLKNIESTINKNKIELINVELIKSMLEQCSQIENLPRNHQKMIIDTLIDTIYWYGNDNGIGKFKIKFIGSDEDPEEVSYNSDELQAEMLQFSSHSMTSI